MKVIIREVFKLIPKHNPISGHRWHEHGPTTAYLVVGPYGVVSRHRNPERAKKARQEWQDYYDNRDRPALREKP